MPGYNPRHHDPASAAVQPTYADGTLPETLTDVACFVDAQTRLGKTASHPEEAVCPTGGS